MPHTVAVSPEARLGVVVLTGHVTGRIVVRAGRALLTRPEWEPGFDEVWDFRDAREVDISPDGLKVMVAAARSQRDRTGPNRVAVVAERYAVDVLLHLFRVLTADLGRTYECLGSLEDAAAWLGVDAELLRQVRDAAAAGVA